jgi:hypothetical protein
MGAPATYTVLRLPAGSMPTIDGSLNDWPAGYFIDSIQSDDNVYGRDDLVPWSPDEFQMQLYCTWDDTWVYFGVKIIRDDVLITSTPENSVCKIDNIKVNPGGQAMAFYIGIDGSVLPNPSSPYIPGSNLMTGMNPSGNGTFPTYEFAIQKDLLDPFMMNMYQFSIGSEENDDNTYTDSYFLAVGAEYLGSKQDWNSNSWDNPLYYPTFTLTTTEGSVITGLENAKRFTAGQSISASPNPFTPATFLSFTAQSDGFIKIYNINGRFIERIVVKAGSDKVRWNGEHCAPGIYIARLTSGRQVVNTRLFLTR